MRYFVQLAFNGTPFVGWQIQPNGDSIQSILQQNMTLLFKENIELTGCGRTDSGVHAKNFYAHFEIEKEITQQNLDYLTNKLNSFLPKEIVIYSIFQVSNDLHARFSAIDRTYRYYVDVSKDPFTFQTAYRVYEPLDVKAMNEAAQYLLQIQDFTSFSKLHTQVNNNNCTVTFAQWIQIDHQLVFTITANRFLRNMVRAIVGTLLLVGKGKITFEQFQEIILEKNRSKAGTSVPAHALFLENVRYDEINDFNN
jgi:tRNA pseudouridine38-40 synthase